MSTFPRVIPVLLVDDGYLVKPVKFGKAKYIGDPINAVRIFNEKQVDELVISDIGAFKTGRGVNYSLIEEIASEAFMPVAYGGGVQSAAEAKRIVNIGIEKVVLNTAFESNPSLVTEISDALGSSSTVVSVDAKKRLLGGYDAFGARASRKWKTTPVESAQLAEKLGAGEVIVSSIDREGTFSGYDKQLIEEVCAAVNIPVIALGGASNVNDFSVALDAGASAVAAGSIFVLNGKHRAVLISYPTQAEIQEIWQK